MNRPYRSDRGDYINGMRKGFEIAATCIESKVARETIEKILEQVIKDLPWPRVHSCDIPGCASCGNPPDDYLCDSCPDSPYNED